MFEPVSIKSFDVVVYNVKKLQKQMLPVHVCMVLWVAVGGYDNEFGV